MTQSTQVPTAPLQVMPRDEFDGLSLEFGYDGVWRAYSQCGLIAHAPSFRELFERLGGRWH